MSRGVKMTDVVEDTVRRALTKKGLLFTEEQPPQFLDFYIPVFDVYIEVKQFHSERISDQMARAPNVIAIQGRAAADFFADMLAASPIGGRE